MSDNSWQLSLFEFACKAMNLMSAMADAPASAFLESTHGMAEAMSKARMQLLCEHDIDNNHAIDTLTMTLC